MIEWIAELSSGQRVLDLCSGRGSFQPDGLPATVVAMDDDPEAFPAAEDSVRRRVIGRSDTVPFCDGSFDLVICHHGLEHIPGVEHTLAEIGRVLKPDGRLVVSIPNGHGLCDGVYRWIFEGGGHVNRFHRSQAVSLIEACAGVKLVRWQKLYSSFAYLRRLRIRLDTDPERFPKQARIFNRLPRFTLDSLQRSLYRGTRLTDRLFRTNLAVYGWAFYFDRAAASAVETPGYLNVCLFCGDGAPANELERKSRRTWYCRGCDTWNPFVKPFRGSL